MKYYIFILIILLLTSCKSGLYTLSELNVDLNEVSNIRLNLNDFSIYTYNICEDMAKSSEEGRFNNCHEDFYAIQDTSTTKKVEEVYLLLHQKTNLVLYFTTFSHKNIRKGKGFLNDNEAYNGHVVLNQIEYIYIGTKNETAGWIHFPSESKLKDIIIHYDKSQFPDKIFLKEANIATAENNYSLDQKIPLADVFNDNLIYNKQNLYDIVFYKKINKIGENNSKKVEEVFLVSDKDKVYFIFSNTDQSSFYKIDNKRIKYRPNFFLIDNLELK